MFKKIAWRAKVKATAIHLGLSLAVFAVVVLLLVFVFYPSFYFTLSGGVQGLLLMFSVDVVLGPLLTFLVFSPHKPRREIIGDFAVIGLVQLGAFICGAYTVYQEHPALTVLYDTGTATALTYREVSNDERFKDFKEGEYAILEGVPIVLFQRESSKTKLSVPLNAKELLKKADKTARMSLNEDEEATLKVLEEKQGATWLIAVLGKYNGTFVALDEQFQFVAKFGEKEAF